MNSAKKTMLTPTCSHWGNYRVEHRGDELLAIHPYADDQNPTEIRHNLLSALDPNVRIAQPMVRQSYLASPEASDTCRRGIDKYVPVAWDEALDLAAGALERVRAEYGNQSIYGGSYGWASAGRFHHAQSQIHRFLNGFGGYTRSVNSYSTAAAEVIMPYVLGVPFMQLVFEAPTTEDIAKHCKTLLLFGGAPMKNNQVNAGGLGAHTAKQQLQAIAAAGVSVINVSPVRSDTADFLDARWIAARPCSDVALMLGIAHTLYNENLHDQSFLEEYCTGFDKFLPYVLGTTDGQTKDACWAAQLSEVSAQTIKELARQLASGRSVLGISWSLQRQEHGEQTYWMITVLGAMLGDLGLPGGGVAYGYGCIHNMGFSGRRVPPFSLGSFPQGRNAVKDYIPVARITEMLESPGTELEYQGRQLTYPDIQLIYWAGGNPFHHHQDLNRLRKAWCEPETIIVHEPFWTATARHADIVFPSTTMLERNDIGGGSSDCFLSPMRQVVQPFAQSRNDYDIFTALARRLGFGERFTEGRSEQQWIEQLYATTQENADAAGVELPNFEQFWGGEQISFIDQLEAATYTLEKFREDPTAHPLKTPSGKIEIFSDAIAQFNYTDCLGHPAWFDKDEWLGSELQQRCPLHLISNQPKTRLHSQFDHGITSRAAKVKGREPVRMNPDDAAERNISSSDVVRIFNDRGACLATAELSEDIRRNVIELATGAWYWPEEAAVAGSLEVHGNPNVLTRDQGTSSLAQGPSAHSCLVQVERFVGELPDNPVFDKTAWEVSGE